MGHYTGGCQCGAVRFEAEVDISHPVACNCSRCQKLGSLLAFTSPDNFTLLSGEDRLTPYHFNTGKIDHLFCSVCGIQSFSRGQAPDGRQMVAVNVNCLDGVEPRELDFSLHDGRSF